MMSLFDVIILGEAEHFGGRLEHKEFRNPGEVCVCVGDECVWRVCVCVGDECVWRVCACVCDVRCVCGGGYHNYGSSHFDFFLPINWLSTTPSSHFTLRSVLGLCSRNTIDS